MSAEPERKEQRSADARVARAGWPESLIYRVWKMWVVRVLLAAIGLVAIFSFGLWYGRVSAGAGPEPHAAPPQAAGGDSVRYWTCSMHPQVKLPKAGQCPICFMDLIPVRAGEGDATAPELELSDRARVLAAVQTSPVERRQLRHEVRMVGKVAADETRITYISSYIAGRLDRLFVNYTGIFVRKGDHLAEIYSPDLLVAQKEFVLALAATEHARQQPVETRAAGETAGMLLDAARRKLELWGVPRDEIERLTRTRQPSDRVRIDAPDEGWVLDRQGYEGMYVETGTRLFTLADLRSVWVLLDAYELDVGFVRYGQAVEFETEAFPGQVFHGQVSYIDPILNEATRTVKVRVTMPNPDMKLRPQMFVRARLKVRLGAAGQPVDNALAGKWVCYMHPEVVKDGPGKCDVCGMDLVTAESLGYADTMQRDDRALAVPQTAVLLTGTRAVVYVERKEGGRILYEGRVVRLGPRAGEYYIVDEGLREGERVVTRGALVIDSALQIQAKPSMMQPAEAAATQPATSPVAEAPKAPAEEPSRAVAGAMYHQHAAPVIQAYLDLVAALAADDAEQAVRSLSALRKAIGGAVPHGLEGDAAATFKEHVAEIAAAIPKAAKPTIDQLRKGLPSLSAAMERYLRAFGHNRPSPLYRLHCPMAFDNKGADWLQAEKRVSNPYFGKSMLRCGEVRAAIGSDGKEVR